MNKIAIILLSALLVMGQDGDAPSTPPPKPQRTLDNDQAFLEKFQVEVLKRDTEYNLYAKDGEELLVHYHGMTPDGKVKNIFLKIQ